MKKILQHPNRLVVRDQFAFGSYERFRSNRHRRRADAAAHTAPWYRGAADHHQHPNAYAHDDRDGPACADGSRRCSNALATSASSNRGRSSHRDRGSSGTGAVVVPDAASLPNGFPDTYLAA